MSGKRPTAVGAYIFAGLFTVGVSEHYDVLAHLEEGQFGVATARRNFPDVDVHTDPETWPVRALRRRGVNLVYCNPPCAPWSNAGTNKGMTSWRSDPRVSCFKRCFGLLESVRPDAWVVESVRDTFKKGRDMLDDMAERAADLGYATTHLLVSGRHHGLPQARKRYMMVCHRHRVRWRPTGLDPVTPGEALEEVEDPMGDGCQPFSDRMKWLWKVSEPGERLRKAFERAQGGGTLAKDERGIVPGRPGFLYYKLDPDKEAPTTTGSATIVHHEERRYLSVNEYKALNGVPQDFDMGDGAPSPKYAELCKAVMPPVGAYVAEALAAALDEGKRARVGGPRVLEVFADRVEAA